MICPFYKIGWCEWALDDPELAYRVDAISCHSEGDIEYCQFQFVEGLEELIRLKELDILADLKIVC